MNNLPVGTIIAWENQAVPSGWAVCDGTNGTPDLRDKFVFGASQDTDLRVTGGSDTHTHTNANTSTRSAHNHGGTNTVSVSGGGGSTSATSGSGLTVASPSHSHSGAVTVDNGGSHNHTVGSTGSTSNLPRYITRVFIRRVT